MHRPASGFLGAVLAIACLVPLATTGAQVMSYTNTNYGLIAGEVQYLLVNNAQPVLVDQFFFNLAGPFDRLTSNLKSNFVYKLQISGRGGVGPLDRGNARPDAAYGFVNWQNMDEVNVKGDGFGVTAWDGVLGRRPENDVYTTTHTYDYFVQGRDAGLTFRFRDYPYGDNVDGYNVSVYDYGELVTVPEPASILLVGAGLLGVGLEVRRRRRAA
ncbi:MAG: PEP-CTERM sorting domain-containing protein [Gemmatimonadota bacterium]|nr:PEP-CTERM sorting domain-containing protein [Gemmatimonadota bacterium]